MQNIRRLNYFCKEGENRKNRFILRRRFGGNHHHQALFLDCVKEKCNGYIGMLGLAALLVWCLLPLALHQLPPPAIPFLLSSGLSSGFCEFYI
jgi:hypothetical protein